MAFVRFCTSCRERLTATSSWPMAHGNNSRTSFFETLNGHIGVPNWSLPIQKISFEDPQRYHDLPALVTSGGMVIVPNLHKDSFDSHSITNGELVWTANPNETLRYSSSPVIYGLFLYSVFEERLVSISMLNGEVQTILSDDRIKPVRKCAPLSIVQTLSDNRDYSEKARLIWGMEDCILCYSIENGDAKSEFIPHPTGDSLRTPVAINPNCVLFTSSEGVVYKVLLEDKKVIPIKLDSEEYILSAPCLLDGRVYFHGITRSMDRVLFYLDIRDDTITSAGILDNSVTDEMDFETSLWYPPVRFGQYMITSDCFHSKVIRCAGKKCEITRELRNRFFAHQSICIGKELFSVSESGVFRWHLGSGKSSTGSFTVRSNDKPTPIGFPAIYANKLIVWCEDRLLCRSIM